MIQYYPMGNGFHTNEINTDKLELFKQVTQSNCEAWLESQDNNNLKVLQTPQSYVVYDNNLKRIAYRPSVDNCWFLTKQLITLTK